MSKVSERVLVLDGRASYAEDVVGGKGASVARMRALGLPVPPAFVLPIEECRRFHAAGQTLGLRRGSRSSRARRDRARSSAAGSATRRHRSWSRCAPAPP